MGCGWPSGSIGTFEGSSAGATVFSTGSRDKTRAPTNSLTSFHQDRSRHRPRLGQRRFRQRDYASWSSLLRSKKQLRRKDHLGQCAGRAGGVQNRQANAMGTQHRRSSSPGPLAYMPASYDPTGARTSAINPAKPRRTAPSSSALSGLTSVMVSPENLGL